MPTKTTILEELSRPNPNIESRVIWGTNSRNVFWPEINEWIPWAEFNAQTLFNMHPRIPDLLRSDFSAEPQPVFTEYDSEIYNEDQLEHSVITKQILPPINRSLEHINRQLKKRHALHLGRSAGTWFEPAADVRLRPDWALVSKDHISGEGGIPRYYNLLPGDTKLSKKWHSSFCQNPDPQISSEDPVRQILHYCVQWRVRYGFIISDAELVVMRITAQPTGEGLAATRARRQQQQPRHYYQSSMSSDVSRLSTDLGSMSIASESSLYQPRDAIDGCRVEYQAIPWKKPGGGNRVLTVRLALFYLCLLAGYGERELQEGYPDIDSSWYLPDGSCVHTCTGWESKKPKKLQYPDPSRERGPEWIGEYLGLESVLTLEIMERHGAKFYYYLHEEDGTASEVLITPDVPIYDASNEQYGHFQGLIWVPATASADPASRQEPPTSGKHSKKHGRASSMSSNKPPKKQK